jgi:hypothetical protein
MSQYDDIQSISNSDKQDMVNVYMDLVSEPLSADDYDKAVRSVEQHFHVLTGWNLSLSEIDWYVADWRGY